MQLNSVIAMHEVFISVPLSSAFDTEVKYKYKKWGWLQVEASLVLISARWTVSVKQWFWNRGI